MLSIVHDMAEADVGDITPEHASGVSKETKLALEEVSCVESPTQLRSLTTKSCLQLTESYDSIPRLIGTPFDSECQNQSALGRVRRTKDSRIEIRQGSRLARALRPGCRIREL